MIGDKIMENFSYLAVGNDFVRISLVFSRISVHSREFTILESK